MKNWVKTVSKSFPMIFVYITFSLKVGCQISKTRYVIYYLVWSGLLVTTIHRQDLSIAIINMIQPVVIIENETCNNDNTFVSTL